MCVVYQIIRNFSHRIYHFWLPGTGHHSGIRWKFIFKFFADISCLLFSLWWKTFVVGKQIRYNALNIKSNQTMDHGQNQIKSQCYARIKLEVERKLKTQTKEWNCSKRDTQTHLTTHIPKMQKSVQLNNAEHRTLLNIWALSTEMALLWYLINEWNEWFGQAVRRFYWFLYSLPSKNLWQLIKCSNWIEIFCHIANRMIKIPNWKTLNKR